MYKYLILALIVSIVGGTGYYLNSSTGSDLITRALIQGDPSNQGVSGLDVYSGLYLCTTESGCSSVTSLTLRDDSTLEIVSNVEGENVPLGQGTWGVGNKGALVFFLDPNVSSTSSRRFSLIAKEVTTMKISNLVQKKNLYPGMDNPTFKRVSNE